MTGRRPVDRALGDVEGRRVLDAGCGQGYFSRLLADRGATVVGVEPARALVDYAVETAAGRRQGIDYVAADLCRVREVAEPGLDPAVAAGAGIDGIDAYGHLPNFSSWRLNADPALMPRHFSVQRRRTEKLPGQSAGLEDSAGRRGGEAQRRGDAVGQGHRLR